MKAHPIKIILLIKNQMLMLSIKAQSVWRKERLSVVPV